ncbi:MAG: metallophosphoesterase, partial [Prevotella sp.]|nr:metallophosphoesterase [Prevotella sp.]
MKYIRFYTILILACLLHPALYGMRQVSALEDSDDTAVLTADGPYIFHNADGSAQVISVNLKGQIIKQSYDSIPDDFRFGVVSHEGKHRFEVTLHQIKRPEWQCGQPEKLFVMSDPHGNFDCVVSLLQGNGVIDENYHWSFGKNQLVVNGDVFDRGDDVLPIFWLFYNLEQEAADAGGRMDFLLGNHEPMVFTNDLRYTKEKYLLLADSLHIAYPELWGRSTELGRWLCSRNVIMKIGRNLLLHAGLSSEFYDLDISIPAVNELLSFNPYMKRYLRRADYPLTYKLATTYGPLWYRGMVKQEEEYHPLAADTLSLLLQRYDVDRIIVGHTIFDDISAFYDNQVIAVNVDNQKNRDEKKGRAILIEKGTVYVVGDEGIMHPLF